MIGKVVRIVKDKGFGFIKGEDGIEYFFHRTALTNLPFEQLQLAQDVQFEENEGPKGPRAEQIIA